MFRVGSVGVPKIKGSLLPERWSWAGVSTEETGLAKAQSAP